MNERPPQFWLQCTTCDVRYMNRSAESLRHGAPDCAVVRCEAPAIEPKKFRIRDGIDLDHPLNQWLKPSCEAIQVTVDNADALMELCGGERAIAPGMLIALKGWTGNWQTAGVDDWIVWLGDGCRVIYAKGFEESYEAVA